MLPQALFVFIDVVHILPYTVHFRLEIILSIGTGIQCTVWFRNLYHKFD